MTELVDTVFEVKSGKARTITLSHAIETDQFAVMYRPGLDRSFHLDDFIQLPRWGGAAGEKTYLSHDNPLTMVCLPGLYFLKPVGQPSQDVEIEVSDGEGFDFVLGRTV